MSIRLLLAAVKIYASENNIEPALALFAYYQEQDWLDHMSTRYPEA
jgi:hypothetical protein